MSRIYFSASQDFSIQANFSAWCGGVHSGILGRGWVQTGDSGQINPATVAVPASGAQAGYCIYRTDDGVGSTFYLKLDYGRSTSTRYCRLLVSLGTGTDGAGTLTGNVSQVFTINGVGDPGNGSFRSVVAGTTGRLCVINNADAAANDTNGRFGFLVSRTVDAAGAASTRGMELFVLISVAGTYAGNIYWQQFIPATGYSSLVPLPTQSRGAFPMTDMEWHQDIKVYFGHTQTVGAPDSNWPNPYVVNFWGGAHTDFANNGIYRLTSYGAEREYFFIANYAGAVGGQSVNWALCIS